MPVVISGNMNAKSLERFVLVCCAGLGWADALERTVCE